MSIYFVSRIGTLTFEFTTDLGFGLAFAVLKDESIFSLGISSDVFCDVFFDTIHNASRRHRLVSKQ